jgi:hypothetical protein
MKIRAIFLAFIAGALVETSAADAAGRATTRSAYSHAVGHICVGALLFDGRYAIGTRAGAIAVSNAIRRTGESRLRRVEALGTPLGETGLATRWISVERRLVDLYATNYLGIWFAIERAHTPQQRATLPDRVHRLIDRSRPLERRARRLEHRLNVPDCTGGIASGVRTGSPPV